MGLGKKTASPMATATNWLFEQVWKIQNTLKLCETSLSGLLSLKVIWPDSKISKDIEFMPYIYSVYSWFAQIRNFPNT